MLLVDEGPVIEPIEGVQVLARATALGIYDHGYVLVAERRPGHRTEGRLWHIRAGRIVLATGAIERPIPFPDNDRPGIMLASAAAAYVERYGVLPGRRFALATTNDSGIESAVGAPGCGGGARQGLSTCVGATASTARAADLLLVSGGWNPNLALWSQAGGRLRFDDRIGAYVPDGELRNVEVVGTATGDGLPDSAAPTWDGTGDEDTTFVDLERDATVADIRRALGAGLTSIEHVKRYTTIGTGSDQGKTGGVLASAVAARSSARSPAPSASRRTARRTCRSRSRNWPAGIAAPSTTRSGPRRSTPGTSSTGPCSRTSASGSGRATSRATASRWTTPCCASERQLAVPWQ